MTSLPQVHYLFEGSNCDCLHHHCTSKALANECNITKAILKKQKTVGEYIILLKYISQAILAISQAFPYCTQQNILNAFNTF